MYRNTSSTDLYQQYEARVDAAIRNYRWAAQMQPVARTRRPAPPGIGAWLATMRRRLEQHLRPAEERSVAEA